MEMKLLTPLHTIVNLTEFKWYRFADLALIVGFQMKLAGIDWRTDDDLVRIMTTLFEVGFIEVDPTNLTKVRIMEKWYAEKGVAV